MKDSEAHITKGIRFLLDLQVKVHSIIIVRKGYIVAEQYYSDEYGPGDLHRIHSCTKSITSALLGITEKQGLLNGLDDKMIGYFPDANIANLSKDKEDITLEHLLTTYIIPALE